jgi:hypothetical protein
MSLLGYIALGLIALVAVIAWMQARTRSGTYTPIASRMPRPDRQSVPLGMEATDIDLVNRTTRRNESLERANTSLINKEKTSRLNASDLHIEPWADDETYAKRFHSVFQRKDKGPKT